MRILFIAMFSVLAFANCQSQKSEQSQEKEAAQAISAVEQGWNEIMAVHDEIMPISMKLPPIWEQMDSLKNTANDADATTMKASITTLQKVHKDMYDWMADSRNIKSSLEGAKDEAELAKIIQKEKSRIKQIKEETNEAFDKANELLKEKEN